MRFYHALKNDIHFQIRYGFYFLYAFFSILYILILMMTPVEYKKIVGSLIILTDPAMLGIFFMGGIWLLEKGEGLHRFWSVSPLRPMEYIMAKSISLALLSTLSAFLIVWLGIGNMVHYLPLLVCVFLGAVVCNLIGLLVASYAHSINHYMLIVLLPTIFLSMPPVLTAFGITHPCLELFPGTALWRMIVDALGMSGTSNAMMGINILFWLVVFAYFTNRRIQIALILQGGKEA